MSIDRASQLTVFHGTRLSAARQIQEHGFRPVCVADQIETMADAHGIGLDDLHQHMNRTYRFTHSDPRPDSVSLVGNFSSATGWANRSPEAARDALMSIYRMVHPDPDDEPGWKAAPQFWVLAQLNHLDPPAVLTVQAPAAALGRTQGRVDTALDLLTEMADDLDGFRERFQRMPEWRAHPDDLEAVCVDVVPVQVDRDVLGHMADACRDELSVQIREDMWGEPGGYDAAGMPWWKFADIWRRLPPARKADLEAVAGHPLDTIE